MSAPTPAAEGVTNPSIDDLLTKTDSKYKLVLYSAKRARQINAYYSQLGEGLLEWAVVHGAARYGTPRAPVEEMLAAGRPALLEIDLQGARQVHAAMPDALMVFLAPPSWEELVSRLVGRGTEGATERERRLATARLELAAEDEFDVTIVNTRIHDAAEELVALMVGLPGHSIPTPDSDSL